MVSALRPTERGAQHRENPPKAVPRPILWALANTVFLRMMTTTRAHVCFRTAVNDFVACLRTLGLDATRAPLARPRNTKGYSSTDLAMGFANVRAGAWYPPEH